MQSFGGGKREGRHNLEDLNVDGKITLKRFKTKRTTQCVCEI